MTQSLYEVHETTLPVIPLRGMWVYPNHVTTFDIGRDFSRKALEKAQMTNDRVFLAIQKELMEERPTSDSLYPVGTIATIRQIHTMPNGNIRVLVEGNQRAVRKEYRMEDNTFIADLEEYVYMPDRLVKTERMDDMMRLLIRDAKEYVDLQPNIPPEVVFTLFDIDDAGRLADVVTSYLQLKPEEHYKILETLNVEKRLELAHGYIMREIELSKLEEEINERVKARMNQSQKEYILREQMQAIRSELGEDSDDIMDDYESRIEKLPIPEDIKGEILKENDRLSYVAPGSPEVNVIRSYLDTILDLPWGKYTKDTLDLEKVREVLDKHHYGLKDVKERILEFIAVRQLKQDMKGSILCLVGPPGVGKTSIVRSIAEAIGRSFVSMRLGGITDESEIRGHRRTYVGAMPGRIISSMVKAKSMNPVFLFDEIDKVGSDFRGDPASALLEVLDPEQNHEFVDRFLEFPFDLSQVMFVTTANNPSTIPDALRDRMELIEIASYTQPEKFQIGKKHLFPKQRKEHGITSNQLTITDSVIKKIISEYTREAGVRELERNLAKICRRAAKELVQGEETVRVNLSNMEKYLGRPKFTDDVLEKTPQVGVVTGLAWTSVGGELLQIEANAMKGKGKIQLTGSLGDVMKESAMAALTYIRSHTEELNIPEGFYEEKDIHIHVPEGAVPKDGPSAGITMTTAMASALTGRPVRHDIAMTGEVTLTGRVLPIGGLKEKVLAARRYGILNIILPKENERDLDEIPEEIRDEMTFYPVTKVEEVLKLALLEKQEDDSHED